MLPLAPSGFRLPLLLTALAWLAGGPTATPESYLDWATTRFTAADCAAGDAAPRRDPDRDGWPNLLEYSLGTHPLDFRSHPMPTFTGDDSPAARCPLPPPNQETGLRLLLSSDLIHWTPAPALRTDDTTVTVPLGEMRFLRFEAFALPGHRIDSDDDGLHDLFEEQLAATNPTDSIDGIGDVHPLDDTDGDGTTNIDEPDNLRPAGCGFPAPPLLDPAAVADAADNHSPPTPAALSVHTPLR